MIRHARAAVLAAVVVCAPAPAFASGADWWALGVEQDGAAVMTIMMDAAAVKTIGGGVVETRLLNQVTDAGQTVGWVDVRAQYDCAQGRARLTRTTAYDGALAVMGDDPAGSDWQALPADDDTNLFVCKGERARFQKREGFTAPMG